MSKFSPEFKLNSVRLYLQEERSLSFFKDTYAIDSSTLLFWCQRFKCHGAQAFIKKHSYYSAHFKLDVLNYMAKNNLSKRQTVAYFDIRGGSNVISQWQQLYDKGGLAALEPQKKRRASMIKKSTTVTASQPLTLEQQLAQLRQENEYLKTENAYLKKLDDLLCQKEQSQKSVIQHKKKCK